MHRNPRKAYQLGLALTTVSAIAWSTTGLFTRAIPLDSWTMLVGRGFFGGFGLLLVILTVNGRNGLRLFGQLGRPGWAYVGISAFGMLFFITSLRFTTVAHVSIIYAAVPFIAAGLGWLALRERPSKPAVIASFAALAGVIVMVGLGHEGGLFGDGLAFGMTTCMAGMMVIARRYPGIPTLPAACLSAWLSASISLPFSHIATIDMTHVGMLALFGLVNSAIGLALFTYGSRLLPPIETALIGALDAPLAPIWVWLMFSERPGIATLVGGAVVFAAVAGHLIQGARRSGEY